MICRSLQNSRPWSWFIPGNLDHTVIHQVVEVSDSLIFNLVICCSAVCHASATLKCWQISNDLAVETAKQLVLQQGLLVCTWYHNSFSLSSSSFIWKTKLKLVILNHEYYKVRICSRAVAAAAIEVGKRPESAGKLIAVSATFFQILDSNLRKCLLWEQSNWKMFRTE